MIELLNAIQAETGKEGHVTSGHRCPDHHAYVDPASFNKGAKHMIGAQVSFYVQGAEDHPEAIIALLMEFYKKNPRYRGIAAFEEFKRDDKHEADISTPPWFNRKFSLNYIREEKAGILISAIPIPISAFRYGSIAMSMNKLTIAGIKPNVIIDGSFVAFLTFLDKLSYFWRMFFLL